MAFVRLCSTMEMPFGGGGRLFEEVENKLDVLVFKLSDGRIVAYEAVCPHAGALLRPDCEMRGTLTCSLHQWRFDVKNGECTDFPEYPLNPVPCELRGIDIYVDVSTVEPLF